jgi:hypothetical protein
MESPEMAPRFNRKSVAYTSIAVLAAGLLGIAIGHFDLDGSSTKVSAGAPDAQTRIDEIHAQMDAMQDEMRDLRAGRTGSAGAAHAYGSRVASAERLAARPGRAMSPEETARRLQTSVDTMDKRFASTPEDPTWAVKAERSVTQVIAADIPAVEGAKPETYDVACRKGMCRIAARFASLDASEEWAELLVAGMAQDLPRTRTLTVPNHDGSVGLMIYAVAPGNESQVTLRMSR